MPESTEGVSDEWIRRWLKITSGEISVNQQDHFGNLVVIELLRRVLGRAAAPAEALDPRRLNRGMT